MELRDYLRVIRRRWMLILACVLVVTGVAAVVTFRTTPVYESQAKLFVSTADGSTDGAYQGSLFSMQRVASYADLVDGRELSQRVIADLGLDVEPDDLSEQITATVVPETVNLEIAVEDTDPALAAPAADEADSRTRYGTPSRSAGIFTSNASSRPPPRSFPRRRRAS